MSDGIFSSFRVSAMGLRAQRIRLDVAAENLANVETTRTAAGGPYRAKQVVFKMKSGQSGSWGPVKQNPVSFQELLTTQERQISSAAVPATPATASADALLDVEVQPVPDAFISEFDPQHPDADETGVVLKPNVDPIGEMMTLIKATRAYEANATALDAAKEMLNRALDI